jgi:hypothetical protein
MLKSALKSQLNWHGRPKPLLALAVLMEDSTWAGLSTCALDFSSKLEWVREYAGSIAVKSHERAPETAARSE